MRIGVTYRGGAIVVALVVALGVGCVATAAAIWGGGSFFGSAQAQTPSPTTTAQSATSQIAPWRVECSGDGKVLICEAIQQIAQRDERQNLVPLVTLLVRYAPDAKTTTMRIRLPLGLSISEPISLRVDAGDPERHPIETCNNSGCYVQEPLSDKMLSTMRTGTALKLTVVDMNKKSIELPLPLLGFGLAYDKIK